ncbi:MAG: hypothetical protein P8I56_06885 [Paracoccaceae bacterium]|jgi:hypothetical protein|nr:hypothetical protein [Paracoccaceae bacterium]
MKDPHTVQGRISSTGLLGPLSTFALRDAGLKALAAPMRATTKTPMITAKKIRIFINIGVSP